MMAVFVCRRALLRLRLVQRSGRRRLLWRAPVRLWPRGGLGSMHSYLLFTTQLGTLNHSVPLPIGIFPLSKPWYMYRVCSIKIWLPLYFIHTSNALLTIIFVQLMGKSIQSSLLLLRAFVRFLHLYLLLSDWQSAVPADWHGGGTGPESYS